MNTRSVESVHGTHGTGTLSWCIGVPRSAMSDDENLAGRSRASGTTAEAPKKKNKR